MDDNWDVVGWLLFLCCTLLFVLWGAGGAMHDDPGVDIVLDGINVSYDKWMCVRNHITLYGAAFNDVPVGRVDSPFTCEFFRAMEGKAIYLTTEDILR